MERATTSQAMAPLSCSYMQVHCAEGVGGCSKPKPQTLNRIRRLTPVGPVGSGFGELCHSCHPMPCHVIILNPEALEPQNPRT